MATYTGVQFFRGHGVGFDEWFAFEPSNEYRRAYYLSK